jgi:import inner membrane translocase subunit TIM44
MLPRNLQALVVRNATRARPFVVLPTAFPPPFRIAGAFSNTASFHSSSRRQNELPKSPFQTFVDVLKEELKKNRELLDNVKQLQGDVDKFQDSETMKKARAAYERARVCIALCPLSFHILTFFWI